MKKHDKNRSHLRICLVSNSSGISGGAEKTLPGFVHELKLRNINVHVILPSKGPMTKELENFNIDYTVLPYRMWMHEKISTTKIILISFINFIMVLPLCYYILKWKCNIVFSNTITVSIGALAAKLTKKKHIWYVREFGFEDHARSFDLGDNLSYFLINYLSDTFIMNSYAVEEKYKKYLSNKNIKVIYEGYITEREVTERLDKSNKNIFNPRLPKKCLMVGTLQKGKGHDDAIKAIGLLKSEGLEVILDIVGLGFGGYKDQLLNLISYLGLKNYVFFHGYQKNPSLYFYNCDLFLMCSKKEAFGIVTIEAMQYGKPVIGTNSGGTKELIREGFNGLLYTPGNYEELAEKIKYLVNNDEVSKRMGENGKKWTFENFTFKRYIEDMIEVLNNS